jgi:hypothetical protein
MPARSARPATQTSGKQVSKFLFSLYVASSVLRFSGPVVRVGGVDLNFEDLNISVWVIDFKFGCLVHFSWRLHSKQSPRNECQWTKNETFLSHFGVSMRNKTFSSVMFMLLTEILRGTIFHFDQIIIDGESVLAKGRMYNVIALLLWS